MSKLFQRHIEEFINKYSLFTDDSKLTVSFSGGVDSVVLVDLLSRLGYSDRLFLIHYNHLNRDSNAKDENFVRKFSNERNLDFKIIKLKGIGQSNFENEARNKRYQSLRSISAGGPILLGHHIDDSFEWSLMQQFKSASLVSSIGIPVVNGNIVRPLMCLTKSQILRYAKLEKLSFSSDPTNTDLSYERNYLRNVVIPSIRRKYPSYLKNYISRATKLSLHFQLSYLSQRNFNCVEKEDSCEIYSFDHSGEYDCLDEIINQQVKRLSSKSRGSTRSQINRIKQALRNNGLGPLTLVDGIKVYVSFNHLYISRNDPQSSTVKSYSSLSLSDFKEELLDRKTFFVSFVKVKNYRFNTMKRTYPFSVDCRGKISPLDLLRQWSKPQNINKLLDLAF